MLVPMGCENGITGPGASGDNVICYEKSYNGHWEIFTNNIIGSNPQDVSNYSGDDEYPQWSPDGKYILYSRRLPGDNIVVMVYDTKAQTNTQLTPDSGLAGSTPQWTPNGKIYFGYRTSYWDSAKTYLMNPDATNKRKILDVSASIYFYQDSYTFLYVYGTRVYKTNIDGTFTEFILELQPSSNEFFTIRDFDPTKGELLVNTNAISSSSSAIATFSAETNQTKVLITADSGYVLVGQRYSRDYSEIVFNELSDNDEYLSVLQNGVKKRLVRILTGSPPVHFSYIPMQFSADDRRVAFSKQIFTSGQWISWRDELYVVDIITGSLHYIDEGHGPSWNATP